MGSISGKLHERSSALDATKYRSMWADAQSWLRSKLDCILHFFYRTGGIISVSVFKEEAKLINFMNEIIMNKQNNKSPTFQCSNVYRELLRPNLPNRCGNRCQCQGSNLTLYDLILLHSSRTS